MWKLLIDLLSTNGKRVNGNGGYEIFMDDIFMEEMEKNVESMLACKVNQIEIQKMKKESLNK